MPRVTRVKSAQPRYRMVPVIDESTGQPKVTPVMRRNGEPKVQRKTGRAITRRVTQADKSQPLPNLVCGKCRDEIKVGDSYLWWATRSPGQRSGSKRIRCAKSECYPKPWELEGNPKRAALMQAERALEDALSESFDTTDAVESAMIDFAGTVREIAQELLDGADNMESGFGHETSMSEELRERGENLEAQADECENLSLEDPPERDEFIYDEEGEEFDAEPDGTVGGIDEDQRFDANGTSYPEAMEEWRDKCRDEANDKAQEVDLG